MSNRVEIRYCTQCRWLLRAGWMAQELLTTFDDEVAELPCVHPRVALSRSSPTAS